MKLFTFLFFYLKTVLIFSQNSFAYVEINERNECFKFEYYDLDSTKVYEKHSVDCKSLLDFYSCDETFYFPNSRKLKTNSIIFDKSFNLLINKNMILSYLNSNVNLNDSSIIVEKENFGKTLFPGEVFTLKKISNLKMNGLDTVLVTYNYCDYNYLGFISFKNILSSEELLSFNYMDYYYNDILKRANVDFEKYLTLNLKIKGSIEIYLKISNIGKVEEIFLSNSSSQNFEDEVFQLLRKIEFCQDFNSLRKYQVLKMSFNNL